MLDQFPQLAATTEASALQCAFLGTSSVVLRDHRTTLLTDGFISRPRLGRVALGGALHPDRPAIAATLDGLGLTEAASIVVTHSHYDHALDAPTVATILDAEMIGSHSTREIARGHDFDLRRYRLARAEKPRSYGDFTISIRDSEHSPGDRCPGEISGPLTPPARARQFRTGETYSVHFAHPAGNVIVHGSAGYRPDCLAGLHADVIFLGVGALGRQDGAFRRRYWDETVVAVGTRRVIPVHWDRFWRPLTEPMRPMPRLFDNFRSTVRFLRDRAEKDGVEIAMAPATTWCDPFAPLR
ncbi:MBL fold metallo-hydrolase [Nocardia ignorata]|uniref:L-ascorbate metabolism protein UlaG (Beta-lactamase superfamily) n=1 Tax=Nocardia ignorata TaxID=145285 RepID=A0A4R6NX28_NOCIG|nr:MBL fold metallo-hydrolase [Nocardia ignorata]TDP28409.1 L-ascorbate metabolism protein UlaG (beta-lactamase superfamily) [Nocardia ignorata]